MAVDINISLQLKGDTSVELQVSDEVKKIIQADSSSPIITFVATGEKGEQGTPGTATIGAGEINHTHLATDSVGTNAIISGSVGYNEIAAGAIRGSKIQTDAITTDKILDGAVTASKLANGLITDAVIDVFDDGVITGPKVKDQAIVKEKIKDGAIVAEKIGPSAVTAAKIQDKTITGQEIVDNVVLGGTTHLTAVQIDGSSPGYIYGPADDTLYVQSHKDLIFKCDSDQSSNPDTSFFRFQNADNTNLLTLDESGNAVLAGNLTLSGNIVVTGTVDGVNVAESISATTAQLTKVGYISVTQPVDLDAMEAKLDGITDNEAIDWTVDQGSTNIHAGNYTDTNTQNTTTLSFVDSTDDIILRNTTGGASSGTDDIKFVAGANITLTYTDADNITIASTDTNTTYSVMGSGNGYAAGLVKEGGVLHNGAFLRKDGSWAIPPDTDTTYSEATSSAEGLMSTAHHDKLDGIAAGAEVNVNADWNSSSGDSEILNKPTIPADLTSDGAGTIHVNNVPTLNQDTTGNAATATTAQGITGATDGDVTITSDGNVTVKLDADNDETTQRFKITDNADATVFQATEAGNVFLAGTSITNSGSDNDLTLETDGSLTFTIDRDNDETSQKFSFVNYNTEVAHLDESGNLAFHSSTVNNATISSTRRVFLQHGSTYDVSIGDATNTDVLQVQGSDEKITVNGTIELGHASDTTIARSAAGTVTIEGNEIQTTNKHRHFINFGINLQYPYSRWIPIGSYYILEQNTDSNPEYTTYVAPHDGKFIKALVRSEEALGDTELKIYKVGDGTEEPDQGSVVDDKHVDIASANTSYTYTFDSDATFSAGDAIAIRIDPTNDPTAAGVVGTFCLEFDLTT